MANTLADHLRGPIEPWRLDLIASHMGTIGRSVAYLRRLYPGHDIEPAAYQALYLAALTYRPGPGSFHGWLVWKMWGAMKTFRRINDRREVRGVSLRPLSTAMVDRRFYYTKGGD
jgi:hypothetical protein